MSWKQVMSAPRQLSAQVRPPSREKHGFQFPGARMWSGVTGLIARFSRPLK